MRLSENKKKLDISCYYAMRFGAWRNSTYDKDERVWEYEPETAHTREVKAKSRKIFDDALDKLKKEMEKSYPEIKIVLEDFDGNIYPIILFKTEGNPNRLVQLCLRALGNTEHLWKLYETRVHLDWCMLSL